MITITFAIMIVLLAISKMKIRKELHELRARENMQIYEDIDLSHIDSTKNVAYEACPPQQC